MIDLADYYSGGYFLIRADNPARYAELINELQVDKVLSLSTLLCPRLAVHWGWTPDDRMAAIKFGIPENKFDEFVQWCNDAHYIDIEHPSMFVSVDAARLFVARFLLDMDGLYLIGAGLYKAVAETDWHFPSLGGESSLGIDKRINQCLPVEVGGTPLGFDVVSFGYGDFYFSALCHNPQIHRDINELFGIRSGQFGLIQTREDAEKFFRWFMEEDENGNHRGEQEPYAYWLLVIYPLTN
jgi:hypothetical protein